MSINLPPTHPSLNLWTTQEGFVKKDFWLPQQPVTMPAWQLLSCVKVMRGGG